MKRLLNTIRDINKLRDDFKDSLKQSIGKLPDNPNINRLSGGAFSVSSKELFSPNNKTSVMSAEYFDYMYQYKTLCDVIDKTDLQALPVKLEQIIETGTFRLNVNRTFRFHPDVLIALKNTLNNF